MGGFSKTEDKLGSKGDGQGKWSVLKYGQGTGTQVILLPLGI